MKTRNYFLLLLGLCVILTASRCKKNVGPPSDNPYGLPNATQTGANIFACRINGQNWISKTEIFYMGASLGNDTLGITGSAGSYSFQDIIINLYKNFQQGSLYNLGDSLKGRLFYLADTSCLGAGGRGSIVTSHAVSGSLTLTRLDRTNKIFSGTFNCRIPIPKCDTLNVTDGRFDIKYY